MLFKKLRLENVVGLGSGSSGGGSSSSSSGSDKVTFEVRRDNEEFSGRINMDHHQQQQAQGEQQQQHLTERRPTGSRSSNCSSSSKSSLSATTVTSSASANGLGAATADDRGGVEVLARHLFDIGFKYTWKINDYLKRIEAADDIDSRIFELNVNGLRTKWSIALRFWTSEEGRKLTNPVVCCLNLISAIPGSVENFDENEVLQIRYNFGVWNDVVKQYEICPLGAKKIELGQSPVELQSLQRIAARDVLILDQHLIDGKDIEINCKISLVRSKVEQNTLALDLWKNLVNREDTDVVLRSADGDAFPAHKLILSARSPILAGKVSDADFRGLLDLDCSTPILTALIQYLYTDRVEALDAGQQLIKCADQYQLPGLKTICERELIDSITPLNVASLILVADNFNCQMLKKACLGYVEDNAGRIIKTVAWKVMEQVNPELFEEVCQI